MQNSADETAGELGRGGGVSERPALTTPELQSQWSVGQPQSTVRTDSDAPTVIALRMWNELQHRITHVTRAAALIPPDLYDRNVGVMRGQRLRHWHRIPPTFELFTLRNLYRYLEPIHKSRILETNCIVLVNIIWLWKNAAPRRGSRFLIIARNVSSNLTPFSTYENIRSYRIYLQCFLYHPASHGNYF